MSLDRAKPFIPLRDMSRGIEISRQGGTAGKDSRSVRERALKRATREFESLFIYQMLKAMRRTLPQGGIFEGITGKETYMSIVDQQLASALARRGGLGLADSLYRQLMPTLEENRGIKFAPPLLKGTVSSPFGMRVHPVLGRPMEHHGVDIAAPPGTEVRATAAGRVIYSGWLPNYGNTVMVEHAGGYVSLYAHNDSNVVETGQRVDQGQTIARVGSTGRATGPHLHFELRLKGNPIDPDPIVLVGGGDLAKNA